MQLPWIKDCNPIWDFYPMQTNILFRKRSKMHIGSELETLNRRLRRKKPRTRNKKNQCPDYKFQKSKDLEPELPEDPHTNAPIDGVVVVDGHPRRGAAPKNQLPVLGVFLLTAGIGQGVLPI